LKNFYGSGPKSGALLGALMALSALIFKFKTGFAMISYHHVRILFIAFINAMLFRLGMLCSLQS
jgi:hypothetical protein